MNSRSRFIRKIVYVCCAVALLLPLSWLSQPETKGAAGEKGSPGGLLAQTRHENGLTQAALGEIDPAGETIKLLTLGLRPVAAAILWEKANRYKMMEDWTGFGAMLEQIKHLQPNYITVWIYQGWNLSYNISVEFDDYRDRYYWVIRGIEFLKEGTAYNSNEPRLWAEIGETIARKIGRADEHVQFRRLFREDDDFNGPLPLAQRDNWLVGRRWLLDAEKMVDEKGVVVRGKTPLLFYNQAPMCLINYSESLEEEGTFGEVAKNAWKNAADAWTQYSNRDLPTQHSFSIRLSEKELFDKRSQDAQAELARLTPPGLKEQIAAEKVASLDSKEREAYDTPAAQRTSEQQETMMLIEDRLKVQYQEIADRITGPDHAGALKAAQEAAQFDLVAHTIDGERDIVNFAYWALRCQVEPEDATLAARKLIHDAHQEFAGGRIVEASQLYDEGLKKWRDVLDTHKALVDDSNLVDEMHDWIADYRVVLHQLDEKFPQPFILQDIQDAYQRMRGPAQAPPTEGGKGTPGESK